MKPVHCAAVDLGATSGRVIVGTWDKRRLTLTEVHRFPNAFQSLGAHDYWNLPGLWAEVQKGLAEAAARFPGLASVGVDTWGVDYVLVDDGGRLVFPPHAYRDARTQRGLQRLDNTRAALARVYAATGIPNVFYNTSLQLAETLEHCPAVGDGATRCLLLPDYFNFLLSGRMENEFTIASTTQLLDVHGRSWSRAALDYFHLPPQWFGEPVLPGRKLGRVKAQPALKGAQVIVAPGHDTAAAYDAMPADPGGADLYVSAGTWSLVGFESDSPLLGPAALGARIANERTSDGRYRPLKNVIGLWLLEQTLKEFSARPRTPRDWRTLLAAAAQLPAPRVLLDTADPSFGHPPSMRAAIDAQQKKRKAAPPATLAGYTRLICDSLGRGHAQAMRGFETLAGRPFERILIAGGGSRNRLLCQATADAAGRPVVSLAFEATAVGNLARQLIALGEVKDLAAFRGLLARELEPMVFRPRTAYADA